METDLTAASPTCPVTVVCTVGGSAAPIRSMLAALRPCAVVFITSGSEGGTRSSRSQVEELVVEDGGPGLRRSPGAPADPAAVRVLGVPLDDADVIYRRCLDAIGWLQKREPNARLVADYTGGTKSMSAGLLLAALSQRSIDIQLMSGERTDLTRVADGSEKPRPIGSERIHADRVIAAAERAIDGWDYNAAARILEDLHRNASRLASVQARRVQKMLDWCETFALWDAFRHREAHKISRERRVELTPSLEVSLAALAASDRKPCFSLCEDLWWNALRRAETGRYEDALARLYRLTESALQAHLFLKHGKETDSIAYEELPASLRARRSPEAAGLGLANTARYLREIDAGDAFAAAIFSEGSDATPRWLARRNHSILAHGFSATRVADWRSAQEWVRDRLRPLWTTGEGAVVGQQLPRGFSHQPDPGVADG